MKLTSVAFFCFTFIVAVTAQTPPNTFLSYDGTFLKKFNSTQDAACIKDCAAYVVKDACDSLCTKNAVKFTTLINKAYERIKKPICDGGDTLSSIPFGQVEIPLRLEINNKKCYLRGSLNVQINRKDTEATINDDPDSPYLSYAQKADWTIEFPGLTVECGGDSFETVGRVDVTVNAPFNQIFELDPSNPNVKTGYRDEKATFQYPTGDPKGVLKKALETNLKITFESANILYPLYLFFGKLSTALLVNCIIPTCNHQCPK